MLLGLSDSASTLLSIILILAPLTHTGCYQKQLCCLGRNFTCISTDDGIDHLPARLRQQRLKKGRRGRWNLAVDERKTKRTGPGLSGDHLHNQEKKPKALRLRSNTAVSPLSPLVRYQFSFGHLSYSRDQHPEITRYYRRHKLIRYSLLNRHIPLTVKDNRGVELLNNKRKLAHLGNTAYENLCYCDEKCVTFKDCCSDYSFVCRPSECVVSEWSAWSSCILDQGSCDTGIQTRERSIIRKQGQGGEECPLLIEKMSCFKECFQPRGRHQPEMKPVALILDYSYNKTRERLNGGNFHKKVLGDRNKSSYYCGMYELGWINRNCIDKQMNLNLYTGDNICVECQPEAQLHSNAHMCTSDLDDGETGFWKLIGPKSCNGIWKKLSRTESCRCETDFPKKDAFLFV